MTELKVSAVQERRQQGRGILIALTVDEGREWLASQPAAPVDVIIVTLRSPRAARGVVASFILATPAARAHSRYERLVAESLPAVQGRL